MDDESQGKHDYETPQAGAAPKRILMPLRQHPHGNLIPSWIVLKPKFITTRDQAVCSASADEMGNLRRRTARGDLGNLKTDLL